MDEDKIVKIEEDGKEYYFEELDRIELENGKKYIALLPMDEEFDAPEEDDGDVIILRVLEENGSRYLEPIEDENEFNEVGNIFEQRLLDLYGEEFDEEDDEESDEESDETSEESKK